MLHSSEEAQHLTQLLTLLLFNQWKLEPDHKSDKQVNFYLVLTSEEAFRRERISSALSFHGGKEALVRLGYLLTSVPTREEAFASRTRKSEQLKLFSAFPFRYFGDQS